MFLIPTQKHRKLGLLLLNPWYGPYSFNCEHALSSCILKFERIDVAGWLLVLLGGYIRYGLIGTQSPPTNLPPNNPSGCECLEFFCPQPASINGALDSHSTSWLK